MTHQQSSIYNSPVWGVMLIAIVFFGTWILLQDVSASTLWSALSNTTKNSPLLLLGILGLYLIRPVTGFPSAGLSFLVGAKFGLVPGLPIVVVGSMITGLPAYFFGRHSRELPAWVPGINKVRTAGESFVNRVGIYRGMFAASLSPTPLDPVAWTGGMVGVSLPVYLLTTMVGAVPWAGAYCYTGAIAGDIAASPEQLPLEMTVFGTAIAALLFIRPTIRWLRNKRVPTAGSENE